LINGLKNSSKRIKSNLFFNKELLLFKKDQSIQEEKANEYYKNERLDIEDKNESFEYYYTEVRILGEVKKKINKPKYSKIF